MIRIVGNSAEGIDRPIMTLKNTELFLRCSVPDHDPFIFTGRDDKSIVGRKHDIRDGAWVTGLDDQADLFLSKEIYSQAEYKKEEGKFHSRIYDYLLIGDRR